MATALIDQEHSIPTVYGQPCPHCGSLDLRVVKVRGGNDAWHQPEQLWAQSVQEVRKLHSEAFVRSLNPITYQCLSCKQKFESLPVKAQEIDLLEEPCTIVFERLPKFAGSANAQVPYINGIGIVPIHRKGSISIKSPLKHNTVFVTDSALKGYKGLWTFVAEPGETIHISFKRPRYEGTKGSTHPPQDHSAYSDASALGQAQKLASDTEATRKIPLSRRVLSVALVLLVLLALAVPAYLFMQWRNDAVVYDPQATQEEVEQRTGGR